MRRCSDQLGPANLCVMDVIYQDCSSGPGAGEQFARCQNEQTSLLPHTAESRLALVLPEEIRFKRKEKKNWNPIVTGYQSPLSFQYHFKKFNNNEVFVVECLWEWTDCNLSPVVVWFFSTSFDHFVLTITISWRNHPLNQCLNDRASCCLTEEGLKVLFYYYTFPVFLIVKL